MAFTPSALNRRPAHLVVWLILLLGLAYRVSLLIQSRDLFIDEANLARNLFERDFADLAQPLSYEQFAPPVFLWIEKLTASLGGYGEITLRFYPFLCGIGALLLFVKVGRLLKLRHAALIYPLLLLGFGEIYLRYSTKVKQYMPDAFLTAALVWLALRTRDHPIRLKFFASWLLAGSFAIWSSMPSVFVLAAVGCAFGLRAMRRRAGRDVIILVGLALGWLLQFGLYYQFILKSQVGSDYLQQFHASYFLQLLYTGGQSWSDDLMVIAGWLGSVWGHWTLSMILGLLLLAAGIVRLWQMEKFMLQILLLPVAFMLAAVAFHQYSLIPRLTLFSMPLLLLCVAAGIDWLLALSSRKVVVLVATVPALICVYNFGHFRWLTNGPDYEPMRPCMDFTLANRPQLICVMETAAPAIIYYSRIHPQQEKYAAFRQASFLHWNSNYDSLANAVRVKMAMLNGWREAEVYSARIEKLGRKLREVALYQQRMCTSVIFEPLP